MQQSGGFLRSGPRLEISRSGERKLGTGEGMETAHPFNCGLLNGTFSRMVSDNDVAAVVDSVDHGRMPVLAKYLVESIDETLAKIQDAGKKVDV